MSLAEVQTHVYVYSMSVATAKKKCAFKYIVSWAQKTNLCLCSVSCNSTHKIAFIFFSVYYHFFTLWVAAWSTNLPLHIVSWAPNTNLPLYSVSCSSKHKFAFMQCELQLQTQIRVYFFFFLFYSVSCSSRHKLVFIQCEFQSSPNTNVRLYCVSCSSKRALLLRQIFVAATPVLWHDQ